MIPALQTLRIKQVYALPYVRLANYGNDRRQHRAHVAAYRDWLDARQRAAVLAAALQRRIARIRWHLMPPKTRSGDTLYSWVGFYDDCCTFEPSVGRGYRPGFFKKLKRW